MKHNSSPSARTPVVWWRRFFALLVFSFTVVLAAGALDLPEKRLGLTSAVEDNLQRSGVEHPVTAVLLNFRAYDTWLEVGVLLLGVLGALAMRADIAIPSHGPMLPSHSVLLWLTHSLFPVVVLSGVYLVWLGTHSPGGAFQGGAVIGAGAVLLRLTRTHAFEYIQGLSLRVGLMSGFLAFLLVGLGVYITGNKLLQLPLASAGLFIIVVELAIMWSVVISFVALFSAARPPSLSTQDSP